MSNSINGVSLESVAPRVPLSAEQQAELSAIYLPPGATDGVYVIDNDGSGSFSAGDNIIPHNSTDARYHLTNEDIASKTLFDKPFDYNGNALPPGRVPHFRITAELKAPSGSNPRFYRHVCV